MDKTKKLMICLIIVIVITSIVLVVALNTIKHVDDGDLVVTEEPELLIETNCSDVTNNNYYYSEIENKLIKYLYYLGIGYDDCAKVICPDSSYKLPELIKSMQIDKIYSIDTETNELYCVKLNLNDEVFKYVLLKDGTTLAYKLIETNTDFTSEIEADKILEQYKNYETINNKMYNSYDVPDDMMVRFLYNNYMLALKNDTGFAYELLNTEYRVKRFGNAEKFDQYVKEYLEDLTDDYIEIDESEVNSEDNSTIYYCSGSFGNKIILKHFTGLNYELQLDTYTLTNDKLTREYSKAKDMQRGIINIKKFFQMINTHDYEAAYNVLNEEFKANNFPTLESFTTYIKSAVYEYNEVDSGEYSSPAKVLQTYKVKLLNAEEMNSEEKEFYIVMKLLNDQKFVMSFEKK